MGDTDAALGFDRPPCVEYVLVRPFAQLKLPFTNIGISYNTFGHAAVRYREPDSGRDVLMNVEGLKDRFVQFREPAQYFFGTDLALTGDQKAVYNRAMIGIRFYDVPDEQLRRLHAYYTALASNERAKFFIVPLPIRDFFRRFAPDQLVQYGNCARFTSAGLVKAGILPVEFGFSLLYAVSLTKELQSSHLSYWCVSVIG